MFFQNLLKIDSFKNQASPPWPLFTLRACKASSVSAKNEVESREQKQWCVAELTSVCVAPAINADQ